MVLKCFRLGRPLPPLTCQLAVNALRVRIDSHGRDPLAPFSLRQQASARVPIVHPYANVGT
jgi:hypothetical protein